jgi:peptidoglycan-associated lipoprotein
MDNWKNVAFCSVVLSTALALGACSSAAKPEVLSPAPSAAPADQAKAESKKQPGAGVSESSAKSSLDALKSGESTGSASGPLKEVYFDFDSYDLRADARETLKANAGWLKTNPAAQVQIEGHADEQGTNEYNLALGAKRAQSVMDYLVTLGSAANRLATISYGEEVPVCKEKTEDCWQKNRRARFVIQPARPTS